MRALTSMVQLPTSTDSSRLRPRSRNVERGLASRAATTAWCALLVVVHGCQCSEDLNIVPGSLDGRACGPETHIGLAGAVVDLTSIGGGGAAQQTLTDSQGQYAFGRVRPGKYHVAATLDDIVRAFDVDIASHENSFQDDTACRGRPGDPDGGTLDGVICNRHTGELLQHAEVRIVLADNSVMLVQTNDAGHFELLGVPVGEHIVGITGVGYQRSFLVTITKGETTTLDLGEDCSSVTAAEGGVVGSFCDPATNANLVGAQVSVTLQGATDSVHDLTDTAGEFLIGGLSPGIYTVDVLLGAYQFTAPSIVVVAGAFTTVADVTSCGDRPAVGRVEGQICDAQAGGRFVGTVELRDPGDNIVQTDTVAIEQDGRFSFSNVAPGVYSVRAFNVGYERVYGPIVVEGFQPSIILESDCPGSGDQCDDFTTTPGTASDGRLLLVVDRSGSMQLPLSGGVAKWDALRTALTQVTSALNDDVEFGLMMFPDASSDQFPSACNENGSVDLAVSAGSADSIRNILQTVTPLGGTPTAVALAAARDAVTPLAQDGRPVAVLLATDGAPNCTGDDSTNTTCRCTNGPDGGCTSFNCLDDQNTIGQVGAIRDLGVNVYVLGLPGAENFSDVLNTMAQVGGTAVAGSTSFYQATDPTALEDALQAITDRVRSCRVATPGTDLHVVDSVTVSIGGAVIGQDVTHQNGWDVTSAGSVELFGAACDLASQSGTDVVVHACTGGG